MATVSKSWVPDRRDVIWIDFNPQLGGEIKNEHPMLYFDLPLTSENSTKCEDA